MAAWAGSDDAYSVTFDANDIPIANNCADIDDDEVIAYCASAGCQCDRVFRPDQNEENGLLICTMCGCLMDGVVDYT